MTTSASDKNDITKWASDDGHIRRQASTFRDIIAPGGEFTPDKGRYHLYVRALSHHKPIVFELEVVACSRPLAIGIVRLPLGPSNHNRPTAEGT